MFKHGEGKGICAGIGTLTGESASVNATLTRARHAHAVRPLMSRSYVICGFELFFSRPLVSAELCSSAMRRKRSSARARVSLSVNVLRGGESKINIFDL